MTVLTGENGTGKTTILNVLSRHFGWNLNLISSPLPLSKSRARRFYSDVWSMLESDFSVQPGNLPVGAIRYADGNSCELSVPPSPEQALYNLNYRGQQAVPGIHIPSHTPAFTYYRVQNIPTDPKTSQQQYQAYQSLLQQLYSADHGHNPGAALKQSLISLAVFGYGTPAVVENPEYRRLFEQFQGVLAILLPRVLGFRRLEIRVPDIIFCTSSGDFPLDSASGGIGAIVGIAWQIFMYGVDIESYTVTIDEPENHLHPSMQRELLPNLFKAFPRVQFIVATHSPFVATSSPQAKVYALVYSDQQRVRSQLLETADLTGTANRTLREILGVPLSVPVWVEQRLLEIIERYRSGPATAERLEELRKELKHSNLQLFLPEAIDRIGGGSAQHP
jgi:hypothetical protein